MAEEILSLDWDNILAIIEPHLKEYFPSASEIITIDHIGAGHNRIMLNGQEIDESQLTIEFWCVAIQRKEEDDEN